MDEQTAPHDRTLDRAPSSADGSKDPALSVDRLSKRFGERRLRGLSRPGRVPPVFVVVVIAINVIPATLGLAVGFAAVLLVLDVLGWQITSRLFDRERLITGTRG